MITCKMFIIGNLVSFFTGFNKFLTKEKEKQMFIKFPPPILII